MREQMGAVAVAAARAVNYVNAGTVEFIVDRGRNFYFLEMNTRLQVEHPVTELVTGLDLVKEQLRIARGRKMDASPDTLSIRGHAIECRINAEDPYNNFLPSVGTITLHLPPTGPGVRLDSSIYAGFEVTPYYDSMLAKLIVWGANRPQALRRLSRALDEYRIMGLKTNLPFHQKLVDSHHFISGKFDTGYVEHYFDPEVDPSRLDPTSAAIIATLVAQHEQQAAAQIINPNQSDTSNWKWTGRYERMKR
jgi:acetyl/propionyl-CoA carboxylase alpha subunit